MMRRIAVVGDRLDNDGEICHYEGLSFTIGDAGRLAALIGGGAYCPVCKTTGYIARAGGPRRMTLGISEIALDQDVVICACPENPRIHARLSGETWYDDLIERFGSVLPKKISAGKKSHAAASEQDTRDGPHVCWVLARDSVTGEPIRNAEYIARLGNISRQGTTDADGYAKIECEEENQLDIHIVFKSPKRRLNPDRRA
jgi:hypothetical protein